MVCANQTRRNPAAQMMNPSMDTGMARPPDSAAPTLAAWDESRHCPVWLAGKDARWALGVIDELIAVQANHLQGHALASTIFDCAYCHAPDSVPCPVLRASVLLALRTAGVAHAVVTRACVCEEEDFGSSVAGFNLRDRLGDEALSDLVDKGLEAAGGHAPEESPFHGADSAQLAAARARLLLQRSIWRVLAPLRTAGSASATPDSEEAICTRLDEVCLFAQGLFVDVKGSLALGAPKDDLGCFGPACSEHARGSSPQRSTPPLSRAGACDVLGDLVGQMLALRSLRTCKSWDELVSAFEDRAVRGCLQPLPRCAVRVLVLSSAATTHRDLIGAALREFNPAVPDEQWDKVIRSSECAAGLDQLVQSLLVVLQVLCQNHARQRRRLGASAGRRPGPRPVMRHRPRPLLPCAGKLLLEWGGVQSRLEDVDLRLQDLGLVPAPTLVLSRFLALQTVRMLFWHLDAGFSLELFHSSEFHMVFWYEDFLANTGLQLIDAEATRGKDAAKAKASGARTVAMATPLAHILAARRDLARGASMLISGLIRHGVMCVQDTEFMTMRQRFEHRFGRYRSLAQPVALVYEQYAPMLDLAPYSAAALYQAAQKNFKAARSSCDAALKWPAGGLSAAFAEDVRGMVKVAIKNGIAAFELVQRLQGEAPRNPSVRWSNDLHVCYPALTVLADPP